MESLDKSILGLTFFTTLLACARSVFFPTWLSQIVVVLCILILAYHYYTIKPLSMQGRIKKLRQDGLYPPIEQATDDDVKNLLRAGHKSAAIELYREIHHMFQEAATASVGAFEKTVRLSSKPFVRTNQRLLLGSAALSLVQFKPEVISNGTTQRLEIALAILLGICIVGCLATMAFSAKLDPGRVIDDLTTQGLYPREGEGTDEDVARLAHSGHKVPAIRLHYEIHRGSPQESANVVKQMMRDAARN
jgi:hypothetical protein